MTSKELCDAQQTERFEKEEIRYHVVISCDHVWIAYGHGYQCANCAHYTGSNTELNALIAQEQMASNLKNSNTKEAL